MRLLHERQRLLSENPADRTEVHVRVSARDEPLAVRFDTKASKDKHLAARVFKHKGGLHHPLSAAQVQLS